jgi:hypothetical protein
METRKRKPQHPFLVVVTLLFGCMLFAVGMLERQEGIDSANWPVVPAVVTATRIEHHSSSSTNLAARSDTYYGHITYRYEHDGTPHEYTGFQIGGSMSFYTEVEAAAHIANYPVGKSLEVHVNPALPHMAVVVTGVPSNSNRLIWPGAFFLLFGVVLLVEWIRFKRKTPAAP